jgi:hypothetical protein
MSPLDANAISRPSGEIAARHTMLARQRRDELRDGDCGSSAMREMLLVKRSLGGSGCASRSSCTLEVEMT